MASFYVFLHGFPIKVKSLIAVRDDRREGVYDRTGEVRRCMDSALNAE